MAVLDAFIANSEDLNLKFSRGRIPPDPASLVTLTRSQMRRPGSASLAFLSRLKLPFPSLSNACHAGYS